MTIQGSVGTNCDTYVRDVAFTIQSLQIDNKSNEQVHVHNEHTSQEKRTHNQCVHHRADAHTTDTYTTVQSKQNHAQCKANKMIGTPQCRAAGHTTEMYTPVRAHERSGSPAPMDCVRSTWCATDALNQGSGLYKSACDH